MNKFGCLGSIVIILIYMLLKFLLLIMGITCISLGIIYIVLSARSMISGQPVDSLLLNLILSSISIALGAIFLRLVVLRKEKDESSTGGR